MEQYTSFVDLFKAWKEQVDKERKKYDFLRRFTLDGIVCPELYGKGTPKVLFVLKEAHDKCGGDSLIDELLEGDGIGNTWHRPAEWARALLYGREDFVDAYGLKSEPKEDENEKDGLRKYFKRIAVMNLKKAGGKPFTDRDASDYFDEVLSEHKNFIRREIELCDPDMIIACGRGYINPFEALYKLFSSEKFTLDLPHGGLQHGGSYFIITINGKDVPIVDYRHPNIQGRCCGTKEEHYRNMLQIRRWYDKQVKRVKSSTK